MTARHVLARFERVVAFVQQRRHSQRGQVCGNLFLTLCLAADDAEGRGVSVSGVAAAVGMCVRNARTILDDLAALGFFTLTQEETAAKGRPMKRYHATQKVYDLLGLKPVEKEVAA